MILKRILSKRLFRAMLADTRGATAIEYGLIIAIISMAIIAGLQSIQGGISDIFKIIVDAFTAAMK
jgi:pilus assembly protein Flp/PilA